MSESARELSINILDIAKRQAQYALVLDWTNGEVFVWLEDGDPRPDMRLGE